MEDSSYRGTGRPWALWAWPAIFITSFIGMTCFGTNAIPGNQGSLWTFITTQAFAITAIIATIKTWGYGFGDLALRLLLLLFLAGLLLIASFLAYLTRHGFG